MIKIRILRWTGTGQAGKVYTRNERVIADNVTKLYFIMGNKDRKRITETFPTKAHRTHKSTICVIPKALCARLNIELGDYCSFSISGQSKKAVFEVLVKRIQPYVPGRRNRNRQN